MLASSTATSPRFTQASPERQTVSARYLIQGVADPNLLSRLIGPFAKLGTVPTRVHASCEDGDGREMSVDLRLADVARRTAELVEFELRRVIGVRQLIAVID
jgi:hypothetical protein